MEYKTVSQGCKYVSSVIDHLTRLVILAAIANKEATTIARTLVDRVFSVFGVPELLHSDMGKESENQLVKSLARSVTSSPPSNRRLCTEYRKMVIQLKRQCI